MTENAQLRYALNLNLRHRWLAMLGIVLTLLSAQGGVADEARAREFVFHYSVELTGLEAEREVRVWLPIAPTNRAQEITVLRTSPKELHRTVDKRYGNPMWYCAMQPSDGRISLEAEYKVKRHEVRALSHLPRQVAQLDQDQRSLFLAPSAKVPIHGKPVTLLPKFGDKRDAISRARKIYDRVDKHVKYDKTKPGYGHGDVLWVCDSRFGNCTDFHSLFISMARSQNIPARFEIGFPLPNERGAGSIAGYHCWAAFFTEAKGWIPVDISEADKHPELKEYYFGNLSENRISFTIGRDIVLEPPQDGPPLNYFIYPYAEMGGKPVATSQIKTNFEYSDLPAREESDS